MKSSIRINIILSLVLLSGMYLGQFLNFLILILLLVGLLIINKFNIQFNRAFDGAYFILLLDAIIVGILEIKHNQSNLYDISKHFCYFILVFIYWHLGEQIVRLKDFNRGTFFRNIVYNSVIISGIDIFNSSINLMNNSLSDINSFRNLIGTGNIISLIGVYLCVMYKNELMLSKKKTFLFILICVISSAIHFSRILLLYAIVFILFSGIKIFSAKSIKLSVLIITIFFSITMIFPDMMNLFFQKIMKSFTEINFTKKIWSDIDVVQNWRGYEVFCAIEQFKTSNLFNRVFGEGFGMQLNVHGYAYLVTDDKRLNFLHNGYFTQLLIWGYLGVILFLFWIYQIYKRCILLVESRDIKFSKSLLLIILIANYFTIGPFFNRTIANIFLFISIMFYYKKLGNILIK